MNCGMLCHFRRSRLMRVATQMVIAGHVFAATPVLAQDLAQATVKASAQAGKDVADVTRAGATRAVRKATRVAADARRQVAKARVRVNRTVPAVSSPNLDPMFGTNVTTERLMRARFFPEQLIPTSAPTADDNTSLARTLERSLSPLPIGGDRFSTRTSRTIRRHRGVRRSWRPRAHSTRAPATFRAPRRTGRRRGR
jgi:hypothetical protein